MPQQPPSCLSATRCRERPSRRLCLLELDERRRSFLRCGSIQTDWSEVLSLVDEHVIIFIFEPLVVVAPGNPACGTQALQGAQAMAIEGSVAISRGRISDNESHSVSVSVSVSISIAITKTIPPRMPARQRREHQVKVKKVHKVRRCIRSR